MRAVVTGAARDLGATTAARLVADGATAALIGISPAGAYLDSDVPLRRLGTGDEVAALIVFLASADASCLTAAAVAVDGGGTATGKG